MNLDDFDNINDISETGAVFVPFNPTDYTALDCSITICSARSRKFKSVQRELIKAKAKGLVDEDITIKLVAGIAVGWENIQRGSETLEFSTDNLVMILKAQDWLYIQLEEFVENPANFFLLK